MRLLPAIALLLLPAATAMAAEPLWLGLAPGNRQTASTCCPIPTGKAFAPAGDSSGRISEAASARSGNRRNTGGATSRFESEHRPLPVRSYFLTPNPAADDIEGLLRKADGSRLRIEPIRDGRALRFTYRAGMGEGPMHGPNNLYVVSRRLEGDTLLVRCAKWCTLHHNCGWGHDHKFDRERLAAHPSPEIPLEIVIGGLWDDNFHSRVMSGDLLNVEVFHHGRPAPGARVRLTSDQGWSREASTDENGRVGMRLIRDLYPDGRTLFDRDQRGELKVEARYEVAESGIFNGSGYRRIELISTFPWRYYPARREYTSLGHGLLLIAMACCFSTLGIYLHRRRRHRPRREIVFDEK